MDNISGGASYQLGITKHPSIDSKLHNEPNNTMFINYIRICFEHCGFPGLARRGSNLVDSFFFDKLKPMLKKI